MKFLCRVFERLKQKVFKDDATVARLILMFPARGAGLVPVLEGFFEVELHGVDELPVAAFDHHLIAAEVGGGEKFEMFGDMIELQSMILPDAQDAGFDGVILPDAGFAVADALEDRVGGIGDADEAVLILEGAANAVLVLFVMIERDDLRPETHAD